MIYFIEQKLTPIINQYRIFSADKHGKKDELIAYVQQKRIAFREQIKFFADESSTKLLFTVRAEKVMDIHGKFLVQDAAGHELGVIRKNFASSLFKSTWEVLQGDEPYLLVRERSSVVAILRRLWGLVVDIPFFLKYHFDFLHGKPAHVIATFDKQKLLLDHYKLEIKDEAVMKAVGWQTFIALAVLLDALQSR